MDIAVSPDQAILNKSRVNGCRNGIDLRGISGSEYGQHTKQGIEKSQPLPVFFQGRF